MSEVEQRCHTYTEFQMQVETLISMAFCHVVNAVAWVSNLKIEEWDGRNENTCMYKKAQIFYIKFDLVCMYACVTSLVRDYDLWQITKKY